MTVFFNQKNETNKRRSLRNNMPKAEIILWKNLSRKQMLGYKFRRQYSVDKFVVDFCCPKLKLAIEIDGDLHFQDESKEEYDRNRQILINTLGIYFLRFQNPEIYKNINGVLRTIETTILKLGPPDKPLPLSLLLRKEGKMQEYPSQEGNLHTSFLEGITNYIYFLFFSRL